ncbi:MAG TPA: STAS domain-containing protein [Acidimicrobiia bacterium]|jgi:anti-sigma B factor antagonist
MSDVADFDGSWSARAEAADVWLLAETVHSGDGATVAVRGELDMASAPALASRLRELTTLPIGSLTLNMAGIAFMDSSGLRVLNECRSEAEAGGMPFSLEDVPPVVQRILDVTGMAELFRWTPPA